MFELILRLAAVVLLAFAAGKLASKLKMPAVLGFLIAGMALGPNAFDLLTQNILDNAGYKTLINLMECCMGLMLGTEMVWRKIKQFGKQIIVITFAQSMMTFFVVSLAFAVIFHFSGIPVFLALLFGGIALATAPAPALSIVNEYKTDGPVTRTLIPLAVIDDVIAICVFLTVLGGVMKKTAGDALPGYTSLLIVLFPVLIGLLTGMVYSAVFSNILEESALDETMKYCNPVVSACFTLIILNLGAPLDYHLILGAGIYTAVYIISRAAGKMGGAALGAQLSHAPKTVKKYLGMVILPHSGVSLVLTGIAIASLTGNYSQYGNIVRGTIAAAAVINEIIAVFVARQGFKLAGEIGKANP